MSKKLKGKVYFEEEGHFSRDKIFTFKSDESRKEIKISARLSFNIHNSKFLESSIYAMEGLELLSDPVVLEICHERVPHENVYTWSTKHQVLLKDLKSGFQLHVNKSYYRNANMKMVLSDPMEEFKCYLSMKNVLKKEFFLPKKVQNCQNCCSWTKR